MNRRDRRARCQEASRTNAARWLVGSLLLALSAGCSDANATAPSGPTPDPACVAPAGVSNAPGTIAEALTLINALPKPLSLPCFLESLARPLEVRANDSLFSAQPADGLRSPRIFLFEPTMVMSVVPAGAGAPLLEFGEQRPDYHSLKAELSFPVLAVVAPSAPFTEVMANDHSTTCGGCHALEEVDPTITAMLGGVPAFVSPSFRPATSDRVSVVSLQHEDAICDRSVEPERCAMLDGLFGWGSVNEHDFPNDMNTFGGTQ